MRIAFVKKFSQLKFGVSENLRLLFLVTAGGRWRRRLATVSFGSLFVFLNDFVDFFAVDGQFRGGLDAEFDGVFVDAQHFHDDAAIDDDAFV